HAAGVDAFALQLFADEAAEVVGADPGQQRAAQAQPGRADRGVGGAASDVLGEGRMSSRRPPTCSPYRSMQDRPTVTRSSCRSFAMSAASSAVPDAHRPFLV